MADYTFHTINDKEFEVLTRDLLQKEVGVTFEDFKSGKDRGIDLRYSKSGKGNIIVQCKHWLKSGISKLKYELKTKEIEKVKKLNPDRYIFSTSLELSPDDKNEIIKIFKPFIKSPHDVIGKETLNNLLTKFPEVEENHYKLWLSSTNVLKKIISEYIRERSKVYEADLIEKIKKFVKTESFNEAKNILSNHKVLLITGEPGIGKTMLADFLTFEYLQEGYELTYILNDLNDASKVFDRDRKQIFYFDDFLGSNYLDVLSEKKFDSQINHLIRAISSSDSHYLILTSRTTIYNRARTKSEIFDDRKFKSLEYLLKIRDYNLIDKGEILYNHLFFSELNDSYKSEIKSDEFYFDIIKHKNFNPRIIEFITDEKRIEMTDPSNYTEFILNSLDNPIRIWEKAFQNQIDEIHKTFLLTLYSCNLPVKEVDFKSAFEERIKYDIEKFGREVPTNYYNNSIKILLAGFIRRSIPSSVNGKIFYLEFINPSLGDFFSSYLSENKDLSFHIIASAKYYEQIRSKFISKNSSLNSLFTYDEIKDYIIKLLKREIDSKLPQRLLELIKIYGLTNVKDDLESLLPLILNKTDTTNYKSIELIDTCFDEPNLRKTICEDIDGYLEYLIRCITDFDDLALLYGFIDKTNIKKADEYISENSFEILEQLQESIIDHFSNIDTSIILSNTPRSSHSPEYFHGELVESVNIELERMKDQLKDELFVYGLEPEDIDMFDLSDLINDPYSIADNIMEGMAKEYHADYGRLSSSSADSHISDKNAMNHVRNLFS